MMHFKRDFAQWLDRMVEKYRAKSWLTARTDMFETVQDADLVMSQKTNNKVALSLQEQDKTVVLNDQEHHVFRMDLSVDGRVVGLIDRFYLRKDNQYPVGVGANEEHITPLGDVEALQIRMFNYFAQPTSKIVQVLALNCVEPKKEEEEKEPDTGELP